MKRVKADLTDVVLVCRKCSKKLKGGFGPAGDQPLAKALRREFAADGKGSAKSGKLRRRGTAVAVIEVGCLDICPKGAVMVVAGGSPGEWLVVPRGAAMSAVRAKVKREHNQS